MVVVDDGLTEFNTQPAPPNKEYDDTKNLNQQALNNSFDILKHIELIQRNTEESR